MKKVKLYIYLLVWKQPAVRIIINLRDSNGQHVYEAVNNFISTNVSDLFTVNVFRSNKFGKYIGNGNSSFDRIDIN